MEARVLDETPYLQWFDQFPSCRMCGKAATGNLMSIRNESYGAHCKKCADGRLKRSKQVREDLAREQRSADAADARIPDPFA